MFQKHAQKEVSFMRIETAFDLANRDRLMPPPLNVIVYPIGFLIHLTIVIFASISCNNNLNLYSKINGSSYLRLNGCDLCWWNRFNSKSSDDVQKKRRAIKEKIEKKDKVIQQYLYKDKWKSIGELIDPIPNRMYECWRKYCGKCCRKCCSKCCGNDEQVVNQQVNDEKKAKIRKERPLRTYHKGCYNRIKLRVNEEMKKEHDHHTSTILDGLSMRKYLAKFEDATKKRVDVSDAILLKQLTSHALFCKTCYRPFVEDHVDDELLSPFRVVLDIISCFMFLFSAWIPLMVLFTLFSIFEWLRGCCRNSDELQEETDHEGFDREYFAHT